MAQHPTGNLSFWICIRACCKWRGFQSAGLFSAKLIPVATSSGWDAAALQGPNSCRPPKHAQMHEWSAHALAVHFPFEFPVDEFVNPLRERRKIGRCRRGISALPCRSAAALAAAIAKAVVAVAAVNHLAIQLNHVRTV